MADLKISQLPSASIATGSDVLPIVQGGVTDQITVTNLGQGIFNLGLPITASSVSSSGGFTGSLFGTSSYSIFAETASSSLNAQDILIRVLNQSGNTLSKGIVVYITASGNSSDIPRVITASYNSDALSANTLGITNESIANGAEGFVMTEGVLKGINTNAFVSGQLIYLGPTGSIIGTAPTAPLHNVRLGQVIRAQTNNGSIYVRIDNGYELGELHDVVDTTTTSSYGDLLVKSGSVWINSKQLTGSYGLTGSWTVNGSMTVGANPGAVNTENTLNVYPAPNGGTGEGGQILLAASGGLYNSASMIDNWQNQFRILKGTNTGGSTAGLVYVDLQNGNTQFIGAVTASAYSGLPNDYLYATRSGSNQTVGSAWANTDIIFNNVVVSKGISFNTSTGVASLTGGKVYRVTARLAWSAAASYNLQFSCYTSANAKIGPDVEIVQSSNGTSNISDGTLEFIYAPGSNTDIKIRCTANNTALSGEQIRYDLNTQFIIQQIA